MKQEVSQQLILILNSKLVRLTNFDKIEVVRNPHTNFRGKWKEDNLPGSLGAAVLVNAVKTVLRPYYNNRPRIQQRFQGPQQRYQGPRRFQGPPRFQNRYPRDPNAFYSLVVDCYNLNEQGFDGMTRSKWYIGGGKVKSRDKWKWYEVCCSFKSTKVVLRFNECSRNYNRLRTKFHLFTFRIHFRKPSV